MEDACKMKCLDVVKEDMQGRSEGRLSVWMW